MEKQELLKLAADLEALSTQDLSDIDALTLYRQMEKEARAKVDEDKARSTVVSLIDSMQGHSL